MMMVAVTVILIIMIILSIPEIALGFCFAVCKWKHAQKQALYKHYGNCYVHVHMLNWSGLRDYIKYVTMCRCMQS